MQAEDENKKRRTPFSRAALIVCTLISVLLSVIPACEDVM